MPTPNILLVILDSVRAKNCSLYGHRNETTPFLSKFAEEAVVFDQARAPSIHSISSHVSIFTGYHVEQHNVTEHKSFVEPEASVWHRLSERGYETGLFTANVIVSRTSNLSAPFDTCTGPKRANFRLFDGGLAPLDVQGSLTAKQYLREAMTHDAPVRSVLNGLYKKLEPRGGSQDPESEHAVVYVDDFLEWVDSQADPWAACINLMDTHTPFVPEPEYDRWSDESSRAAFEKLESDDGPAPFTDEFWDLLGELEPLYDGTIRQADAALERLVDQLRRKDILDDTLVVLTSDHGEGFGEHSEIEERVRLRHHSWGIDEALTHVPLLVREPGGSDKGRISEPATLTAFPDAIEAALNGRDPSDALIPSDEPVISSTYRIRPPGNELDLDRGERDPYFGPWRAVYETSDEGVVKYTRRGADAATLDVSDPQETIQIEGNDGGTVEQVFDSFGDVGVKVGSAAEREMSESVEDRLADLGYLQ